MDDNSGCKVGLLEDLVGMLVEIGMLTTEGVIEERITGVTEVGITVGNLVGGKLGNADL